MQPWLYNGPNCSDVDQKAAGFGRSSFVVWGRTRSQDLRTVRLHLPAGPSDATRQGRVREEEASKLQLNEDLLVGTDVGVCFLGETI